MNTNRILRYYSQNFNEQEAKVSNWFRENGQRGIEGKSLTLVIATEVPKRYHLVDPKTLEIEYSDLNWESLLKVQEDFQADMDEESIKFLRAAPPASLYPVFESPRHQRAEYFERIVLGFQSWFNDTDALDWIETINILRGALLGALASLLCFSIEGSYQKRLENEWLLINIPAIVLTAGMWWVSERHLKYLRTSIKKELDSEADS